MVSLGDLANIIGAECIGDTECIIDSIADLREATQGQISFLTSTKYIPHLEHTNASAVITTASLAKEKLGNFLVMKDPYLGYAKAAQYLADIPKPANGIHPSASIAEDATIGENVAVGAHSVIESGAVIGAGTCIGPQVFIGQNSRIGENSLIYPQVAIYHDVSIGVRAIIHSHAVIGSDGFGYANESGSWVKIPQLAGVTIGDDFEMGANSAIDRGALTDTTIGNGVILDNLIHIAHNVSLGDNLAMAAMSAIAGGTKIGKGSTLAGRASVIGHLDICDNTHISVNTLVTKSIDEPGVYSSGDVAIPGKAWKRKLVRINQLDTLYQRVKELEKTITQLTADRENNND